MGVDPLRFPEVDYSSAQNDFGGFSNASNFPNYKAFATLQADGSITAWGNSGSGSICPNSRSPYYLFALIQTWGNRNQL
jgi:hypothetical protein